MGMHWSVRCPCLEASQPPWETRSKLTNSLVGKRELLTDETLELKYNRNRCESVNSVKDRIYKGDKGAE